MSVTIETPEQIAARLLRKCEHMKKYRQDKRANETQEEAAERRSKQRVYSKRYRKMAVEIETPEEAKERRAKRRNIMQIKKANETPEQTKKRLLNRKATNINYSQKKRANETPEQAATRLLKTREYRREYSKKMRANETPEQAAARRLYFKNHQRQKRAHMKRKQHEEVEKKVRPKRVQTRAANIKYESIDDQWDGSSTWSSEGGYTQTTIEESCSRTSIETREQTMVQYNSDVLSKGKSEPSRDNGFFFEISEIVNSGASANESLVPADIVQEIIVKEEVDL